MIEKTKIPKEIQKKMNFWVWSLFFVSLLDCCIGTMVFTVVNKATITATDVQIIQAKEILVCIFSTIFTIVWGKFGRKLYKFSPYFDVINDIIFTIMAIYMIYRTDLQIYYISISLIHIFLDDNISQSFARCKLRIFEGENLVKFQSLYRIVGTLGGAIGAALGILLDTGSWNIGVLLIIYTASMWINDVPYWKMLVLSKYWPELKATEKNENSVKILTPFKW